MRKESSQNAAKVHSQSQVNGVESGRVRVAERRQHTRTGTSATEIIVVNRVDCARSVRQIAAKSCALAKAAAQVTHQVRIPLVVRQQQYNIGRRAHGRARQRRQQQSEQHVRHLVDVAARQDRSEFERGFHAHERERERGGEREGEREGENEERERGERRGAAAIRR